jgi:hypothetical protein
MKTEGKMECSLARAVELCKIDGGTFYREKENKFYVKGVKILCKETDMPFRVEVDDFNETWTWEPPKKSAFEKWVEGAGKKAAKITETHMIISERKEGWNAAIDEVLKLPPHNSMSDVSREKAKELKEP